ncbi:GAF domain-containing protein [Deinococcus sp. UYEF24]
MNPPAEVPFEPPEASPSRSLAEHLQDVTEALAAARTQAEVLSVVLKPALQALGAVSGAVLLVSETGRHLRLVAHQGYVPGTKTLWQDSLIEDQGPAADVLRTREALYFEYAGELKVVYPDLEAQTGVVAATATAVLPMFLDGRPLGSLVLDFKEPHTFTLEERRFLRTLASQCAVALGRADSLHLLEQQLQERTRKIEEDARAQEAFIAFTEAIGGETDLFVLIRQAVTVLQGRFPRASIVYYEQDADLWKARVWSHDLNPGLADLIAAGLPAETPLFAEVLRTRQPVFTDAWDAEREGVALSEEYGAAANYPLMVGGELRWLLSIGRRATRRWTEADRGMVRAVGWGLNLALERTETARQLTLQNAELLARTRALEAFAELTHDLALTTDPLLLIKRAQEVVMSMLADGAALYYEPKGERWYSWVQHGTLHSAELQNAIDAGLSYTETNSLLIPWTTGKPHFQDHYDQDSDHLASVAGHIGATASLPLRVEGKLTGVLAFALFHQRAWSNEDRVLLVTAMQSLELALDRAAKTRTLEEERTALEAFTRFTRSVGGETDVMKLVQQAITLLEELRSVDVTYMERDGAGFKVTQWNDGFPQALLDFAQEGYPLDQPSFVRASSERQAIFEDAWDAAVRGVPQASMYGILAIQPFFQDGEMISMLVMGSRSAHRWSERDKGIFQAVGQSLDLALDRARQTRTVTAQRDALEARTHELSVANEELEAFSHSVSHDLRTPVRHIIGFLQLARTSLDGKLDERSARYLDVVEQAGGQMNAQIDALLDLSRAAQQPLRLTLVDLNEMMVQLQERLLPDLLTRDVRWEVAPMPLVRGDRDALKQVLTQLTENALKFTRTRDPAVIKVWSEDQGDAWGVFVEDNGLGFDPRYQERLFNMFQRLHSVHEAAGTGVGLASVRRLILKHGGQVFAKGQVGEGATFGFVLPKNSSPRL